MRKIKSEAVALMEEPAAFWAIGAVLVVSFGLYAFFIQQTIQNVALRQDVETEISALSTKIGELEYQYISMKNDITIDRAYAMGFKDVSVTQFVSRAPLAAQVAVKDAD